MNFYEFLFPLWVLCVSLLFSIMITNVTTYYYDYCYYNYHYMTGRIVLSHVHVSTLRRTRSTEKLISTGLAGGGIITLE